MQWSRRTLMLIGALSSCSAIALGAPAAALLKQQHLGLQLSYQQISMPDGLEQLGIAGLEGIWYAAKYWYAGAGLNASVHGDSGGYFAINGDGGLHSAIYGPIWADLGFKVGTGGGNNLPVGGGLYVEPHAGLSYHFDHVWVGANYSYVNFTSGSIKSNQLQLTVTVPFTQSYANAQFSGQFIETENQPLMISRNTLAAIGQLNVPDQGTKNRSGHVDDKNFEMIGIEISHYMTDTIFGFGRILGAVSGHQNGYASVLGGAGYTMPLDSQGRFKLNGRIGVGSAGGANIDTGGGFIVRPSAGLEFAFNHTFSTELEGGYTFTPDGHYDAINVDVALRYHFNNAGLSYEPGPGLPNKMYFQGWRTRVLNETYFNPKYANGATHFDMQLVNINIDYLFNNYFYVTGQTAFAYAGHNSGGYFSGMLGVGGQLALTNDNSVSIFAEALGGAAGGANLGIDQGAIIEPLVGLNYQIDHSWGAQISVGQLVAAKGGFNSTVANFGVTYSFSILS